MAPPSNPLTSGVLSPQRREPADVQAWADEAAAAAAEVVHVSSPAGGPRGTSVRLCIPLDAPLEGSEAAVSDSEDDAAAAATPSKAARRKPVRRDSLDRREALLKGNEGSRQRRRWENDRLLNNPWAEPPLPSDWLIGPTHPVRVVPYFLAPLWDAKLAARREEEFRQRRAASKVRKAATFGAGATAAAADAAAHVPKELRARLRRSKAAKPLLRDLEQEVRLFVEGWDRRAARQAERGLGDVDSDEDDDVVFVGRDGEMHDMPPSPSSARSRRRSSAAAGREKLVLDSALDDHGASFGRWLVHSIATYYGLRTWSVTTGDPARREAYVGITQLRPGAASGAMGQLPTPLWGMV